MLIDTHCHLDYVARFETKTELTVAHLELIKATIAQAHDAGVTKIINVGTGLAESKQSITIAQTFENVWATVGLHPTDCFGQWRDEFQEIAKLAKQVKDLKVVGIGETGIDFYHKPYEKDFQSDSFRAHIELALEANLPLVVHIRDILHQDGAAQHAMTIMDQYRRDGMRGVIHCFQQNVEIAKEFVSWGFMLGIDGPVTYPNNHWLRDVVEAIPLESLILETDSPFLTPQQFRGKPNQPAYLKFVAEQVAQVKGISYQEVAQQTTANAEKLFGV